ncbi:MAG: rane protein [Flaviaesturariibacter sp.]|nr:rane protein [Flaviaesturariibacter sp.]
MQKTFFVLASSLAGLAVVLGAFGAHSLRKMVAPEMVATFQTGVQYQMYHAFALFIVALVYDRFGSSINAAGWLFTGGIILFSGSLYALTLLKATGRVGLGGIGILTPIGGLLFVAGWVLLALAFLRK